MAKKQILFGITGGIAAYRACDTISSLVKSGHEVRCVMTRGATQFVTPLTFETVSRQKAFTDLFDPHPFDKALHIALAETAELVVIMPASANILAKARLGLADDLLSSVLLSVTCPILIVPAMNTQMWENPATQENIQVLRERNYQFIDPISGELTCGTTGVGHIAENDKILDTIQNFLK